jgi:hypothetical protein
MGYITTYALAIVEYTRGIARMRYVSWNGRFPHPSQQNLSLRDFIWENPHPSTIQHRILHLSRQRNYQRLTSQESPHHQIEIPPSSAKNMANAPFKPKQVPEHLEQNENDEDNEDYSFSFEDDRSHNSSQPIVPAIRTLHSAFVRRRSCGNRVGHRLTAWHIARLQATILHALVDSGPNAVLGAEASNESNADYGATSYVGERARIGRWSEEVGYETWGDGYDEFGERIVEQDIGGENRDLEQQPEEPEVSEPGDLWSGGSVQEFWDEDTVGYASEHGATEVNEREPCGRGERYVLDRAAAGEPSIVKRNDIRRAQGAA